MKTDINRLHQVAFGQLRGRRWGKTYLQCHNIAGTIEVGDRDIIVCIVSHYSDIRYIIPMLMDILDEHDLKILKYNKCQNCLYVENKQIRFITDANYEKILRLDANIIFIRCND